MSDYKSICRDEERRRQVRKRGSKYNGLDYLEVSVDQRTLSLYFINAAPSNLQKGNFRIEGGERITGIEVIWVDEGCRQEPDLEIDACVQLTVNKPGDYSTYRLCWVEADADGNPTNKRAKYADPIFGCLEFSFKTGCLNGLDCADSPPCPPPEYEQPAINYLAKDYASFRQLILDRLAVIMPDWKERHIPDIGIALVELLAYTGDYLSYYQDAVATEAYLDTARERISVRRHARLVDYLIHEGCNARAWVCVNVDEIDKLTLPRDAYFVTGYNQQLGMDQSVLRPKQIAAISATVYESFYPRPQTTRATTFYAAHNSIRFYTWGKQECCLPKGSTQATLRGRLLNSKPPEIDTSGDASTRDQLATSAENIWKETPELALQAGDMLIFEEICGPKTGNPDDADPLHRQAVRLTRVEAGFDPAYNYQPVIEIEWAADDALTFALCLSSIGPAPDCIPLHMISVARGNVLLVDHRRHVTPCEPLGKVPASYSPAPCDDCDDAGEMLVEVGRLKPEPLKRPSITFSQPLPPPNTAASQMLIQDPRQARAQVWLVQPSGRSFKPTDWRVRADLLASGPLDQHFVVEIDNDARANLRFGDGIHGQMPQAGENLFADYYVGNGIVGNVGAETISHIVTVEPVQLSVRNPLPAQGGMDPETLESVRMFAPIGFRRELMRAVTPDDYAWLAERYPDAREDSLGKLVQRAAAVARWTGCGYEILLAIDPVGTPTADWVGKLLSGIEQYMVRYRRIGHDLIVRQAQYAYLDIEICVTVLPQYFRGHVKSALLDAFSDRHLPNGQLGFFHPNNLTFGDGIYLSKLIAVAQSVMGVESAWVTKLERMFDPVPGGDPNVAASGVLRLSSLEIARVDNDPNEPERGRIVFKLEGGR